MIWANVMHNKGHITCMCLSMSYVLAFEKTWLAGGLLLSHLEYKRSVAGRGI